MKIIFSYLFTDETVAPAIKPFIKGPKAIFPLSKTTGPADALNMKIEHVQKNVGYDPRHVAQTGILSSASFNKELNHNSFMQMDLSQIYTENLKEFTILMWIRPNFADTRTILVSSFE